MKDIGPAPLHTSCHYFVNRERVVLWGGTTIFVVHGAAVQTETFINTWLREYIESERGNGDVREG